MLVWENNDNCFCDFEVLNAGNALLARDMNSMVSLLWSRFAIISLQAYWELLEINWVESDRWQKGVKISHNKLFAILPVELLKLK